MSIKYELWSKDNDEIRDVYLGLFDSKKEAEARMLELGEDEDLCEILAVEYAAGFSNPIYISIVENKAGDWFCEEFENKTEAIEYAEREWDRLSEYDKKYQKIWVIKSANPDENAEDHFDGDVVWEVK